MYIIALLSPPFRDWLRSQNVARASTTWLSSIQPSAPGSPITNVSKLSGSFPRSASTMLTMSPYYRDPDDNGIDLSIDNVEKADWHEWMRTQLGNNPIGVPLDPDDLARKYHAGMPEAELRRFDSSSRKLDPEML